MHFSQNWFIEIILTHMDLNVCFVWIYQLQIIMVSYLIQLTLYISGKLYGANT